MICAIKSTKHQIWVVKVLSTKVNGRMQKILIFLTSFKRLILQAILNRTLTTCRSGINIGCKQESCGTYGTTVSGVVIRLN